MVAALGFGGKLGALGATLHLLFHAVTKPLMFFCAGNVEQQYGTPYLHKVKGVIHTLPWTGGLFLLATFAVTGTPPFSIFQSEFITLSAALAADQYRAAGLFVLGVVTIFAGFLLHLARMNLGARPAATPRAVECPWKLGAMVLVAGVVIGFALWLPPALYQLVEQTARIIEGAP
jgi:hydrogenase-4 component F